MLLKFNLAFFAIILFFKSLFFHISFIYPTANASSEKSQEIALENQNNLERIREMLLKSREALRSHYDFILLASVHSEQTLPDIGQSRSAIVVETLRNFFLVSDL